VVRQQGYIVDVLGQTLMGNQGWKIVAVVYSSFDHYLVILVILKVPSTYVP
jgi:hypothetical protein